MSALRSSCRATPSRSMRGRAFIERDPMLSLRSMSEPVDEKELTRLFEQHLAILQERYSGALREAGLDAVVLHSGTPKPRSAYDDQYFPLRPTPHFQHCLPLVRAESAVLFEQGKKPT